MDGVFTPNLTSKLLLKAATDYATSTTVLLDLGCGGGYVGVELAKAKGIAKIFASDADAKAAARIDKIGGEVEIDYRCGHIFEPWRGCRFDLIVDDVSGVCESIAKVSDWFIGVPCESGECGSLLVGEVLQKSRDFLTDGGALIFPVISLSNRRKILDIAAAHFGEVRRLVKKEWPLPDSLLERMDLLQKANAEGNADFREKFGMVICYTEIFIVRKER